MAASADNPLPFVSVVIPALDCADEVRGIVAALRAQTYPPERFEIVVADNGSSDDTASRLRALSVACVPAPERGRSRALNAGLRHARGEIICTTDMACRPARDWIERIVECFADPTVGCVAGEIRLIPTARNIAIRYQERSNYMSPLYAASRRSLPFLPFADGANSSFRRELFERIGPFDDTFIKGADVEICYRMFTLTSYKLVFCRAAVVAEAGEPTLAALLRQRFRIGLGSNLLAAKYPEFFAKRAGAGIVRRGYWRVATAARTCARYLARPSLPARADLEDAIVRTLMSASQSLGRRYGRWYLERRQIRPARIDPAMLANFIRDLGSLGERVIVR